RLARVDQAEVLEHEQNSQRNHAEAQNEAARELHFFHRHDQAPLSTLRRGGGAQSSGIIARLLAPGKALTTPAPLPRRPSPARGRRPARRECPGGSVPSPGPTAAPSMRRPSPGSARPRSMPTARSIEGIRS